MVVWLPHISTDDLPYNRGWVSNIKASVIESNIEQFSYQLSSQNTFIAYVKSLWQEYRDVFQTIGSSKRIEENDNLSSLVTLDLSNQTVSSCECETGGVSDIVLLDSPWELDLPTPPLRILSLEPDVNPSHAEPRFLNISDRRYSYRLALDRHRPLLVNLCAILQRHDPDLLLTTWGDTWLLPRLLELSEQNNIPLPLNRDPGWRAEGKARLST
jgi:hypothetical protein